jgi:two-component sensor histidine kinase
MLAQQPLPDSLQHRIDTAKTANTKLDALIEAGDYYYQQYNTAGYSKAAACYEKAREIANASKDSILIGIAYHSLAQVYDAVGDDKLPRALEYYKLFNRTSFLMKDTPIILRSYINIAHTQMRLKQEPACIATVEQLIALAVKYNRLKNLNRSYVVAAFTLTSLHRFDLGRKYFDKIDVVHDTITNGALSYNNMYHLSRLNLLRAEKKYGEGLNAGEEALKVCTNPSDSMTILGTMADLACNSGLYKAAYDYKKKENDLYGNITRGNSFNEVNNSLLKSELKLKEENDILVQSKQATQQKINNWLTAGLILMSLAIAGILWLAVTRRKKNRELAKQVAENKLLLQEVNHRVKNNLQIVNSFLLLEENKENGGGKIFLRELQSKIQAMALLHQKLHSNEHSDEVPLQPYFEQLFDKIVSAHVTHNEKIDWQVDTAGLYMRQDKVMSLALITTELLLNTIKYVAPVQACTVSLAMYEKGGKMLYEYKDNGKGLPETIHFDKATTTGLMLVKQLGKQLGAGISIIKEENANGFSIQIPQP